MAGKEKLLSKRILATLLAGAVLGVCNLMPVYAANSGGTWSGESWTKDDEYIGDKSPTGSTVVIAEDNSGKRVYGGKDNRAAVANNTVTILVRLEMLMAVLAVIMMLAVITLLLMVGQ